MERNCDTQSKKAKVCSGDYCHSYGHSSDLLTLSSVPSSAAGAAEVLGVPEDVPASDWPSPLGTPVVPSPAIAEELAAAEPCASAVGVDAAVAVIAQQYRFDTKRKAI